MEENMTEKEQATALIEEYAKLQRIKTAEDRDSELEYQIKITKAKLTAGFTAATYLMRIRNGCFWD